MICVHCNGFIFLLQWPRKVEIQAISSGLRQNVTAGQFANARRLALAKKLFGVLLLAQQTKVPYLLRARRIVSRG